MINRMLKRRSRYFVTLNALTRIFLLFGKGRVTWSECRQKAEMLIFKCEQNQVESKLEKFGGNNFYKEKINGVFFVRGRNTVFGETRLFLIPPETILRDRVITG